MIKINQQPVGSTEIVVFYLSELTVSKNLINNTTHLVTGHSFKKGTQVTGVNGRFDGLGPYCTSINKRKREGKGHAMKK